MTKDILILAATFKEIEPFLKILNNPQQAEVGKRKIISGHYGHQQMHTVITDPGMVNAAQAMTAAVESINPSIIIQTGCAGAFKQTGLRIGDIGIATEEIDLHLGIEAPHPSHVLRPLPFSVLRSNRQTYTNRYPAHPKLTATAYGMLTRKFRPLKIGVFRGPFLSVSTITATDERAAQHFDNYHAIMEQMEGSGTAHLSLLYNIPFIEIRSASNWVGNRKRHQWDIPLAAENVARALGAFVESLPAQA
jgi:futalosine hydrolase